MNRNILYLNFALPNWIILVEDAIEMWTDILTTDAERWWCMPILLLVDRLCDFNLVIWLWLLKDDRKMNWGYDWRMKLLFYCVCVYFNLFFHIFYVGYCCRHLCQCKVQFLGIGMLALCFWWRFSILIGNFWVDCVIVNGCVKFSWIWIVGSRWRW